MPRFTSTALAVFLALLVLSALWWMTSGDPPFPPRDRIQGLSDSTEIHWTSTGVPAIQPRTSRDALSALGYVHGMTRAWTVVLWRQTAMGTLNRWFGEDVVFLDRHARRLGFARQARAAFEALSHADKDRLRAYSRGINAALESSQVQNSDSFVLFGVQPSEWAPWHTLAVEQLLAWMATQPATPPEEAPSSVQTFSETDRDFRRWLHLHGWSRSVAWAVRSSVDSDSTRAALFQRHVLGASASPIVQEVIWERSGVERKTMATLPGVPVLPTGTSDSTAWASLLHSSTQLTRTAVDSSRLRQWHERLEPTHGDEHLIQIERLDETLPLAVTSPPTPPPQSEPVNSTARPSLNPDSTRPPPPDTAWVLQWPGFAAPTDVFAWLDRAGIHFPDRDSTSFFRLFEADGLRIDADGAMETMGTPPIVVRDTAEQMLLVGRTSWARHQAQSLRTQIHDTDTLAVSTWSESDSSTWAASVTPHLQSALQRVTEANPSVQNAATFLRNWDHTYSPASIGATIYEHWMRTYRREIGHIPSAADTTVYFSSFRQQRALERALDTLVSRMGPAVRRWRWERAVEDRRFFPVWSADFLTNDFENLQSTRYAPLLRTGSGHPSTLGGGPSLLDPPSRPPSPTTWDGWTSPPIGTLRTRRHRYDPTGLFSRSMARQTHPSVVSISSDEITHKTTLLPARAQ